MYLKQHYMAKIVLLNKKGLLFTNGYFVDQFTLNI